MTVYAPALEKATEWRPVQPKGGGWGSALGGAIKSIEGFSNPATDP